MLDSSMLASYVDRQFSWRINQLGYSPNTVEKRTESEPYTARFCGTVSYVKKWQEEELNCAQGTHLLVDPHPPEDETQLQDHHHYHNGHHNVINITCRYKGGKGRVNREEGFVPVKGSTESLILVSTKYHRCFLTRGHKNGRLE